MTNFYDSWPTSWSIKAHFSELEYYVGDFTMDHSLWYVSDNFSKLVTFLVFYWQNSRIRHQHHKLVTHIFGLQHHWCCQSTSLMLYISHQYRYDLWLAENLPIDSKIYNWWQQGLPKWYCVIIYASLKDFDEFTAKRSRK